MQESVTGRVIVVQFVTADGVVEDPDGSGGTPMGGWAFRAGPEVFAGDKFDVGDSMRSGALLLGRTTWEMFSTRWPERSGGFADLMNSTRKVVASRTLDDVSAWKNSEVMVGGLDVAVPELTRSGDVVVVGSTSITHALAAAGLVDQYRLLVVPTAVGMGTRLFADGAAPVDCRITTATRSGPMAVIHYDIER